MGTSIDLDLTRPELVEYFFFEDQNALGPPPPDFGCELPSTDCEPFFTNHSIDFDWSQSPTQPRGNTPLDIKQIFPPNNRCEDGIHVHIPEQAGYYSEEGILRIAWPEAASTYPAQRPICTYDGCTSTSFRTSCDLKMHLSSHSYELLSDWVEGEKQHCKWPKCLSKARFKSKKAFQTHLENIHVDPLLCPEKDCSYRIPFRSNYDLKRHVRTVHYGEKDLQFKCPFPGCGEFPKTFVRKDKWLNHLRSAHDDAICPLNHCDAGSASKLVEHIKNCHGSFECKIGSCAQQLPSRFAKFELIKHLEIDHGLQNGDINVAQNAAVQARDHAVRSEELPRTARWMDCRLCSGHHDIEERKRKEVVYTN